MSASPADPTGFKPGDGNPARRPKPSANPLRQNRRAPLGKEPKAKPQAHLEKLRAANAQSSTAPQIARPGQAAAVRDASLGFVKRPDSPEPTGELQTFPIIMTKRDLMEGLRFHVARFQSDKRRLGDVDIRDRQQFTRPIRLHRRDPQHIVIPTEEEMEVDSKENVQDDKEKERIEAFKAERQRQREEAQKLIAPNLEAQKKKPQSQFKKKTEQVFRANDTPEQQKKSQLRYEEALPWHIEDDDNSSVWQGIYEAALSETHVLLAPSVDRNFSLIPVEKYYKFKEKTSTKHAKKYNIEEVEAMMKKRIKEPRWVTASQNKEGMEKELERALSRRMMARRGGLDEDGDEGGREEAQDGDDIDFDLKEEFADDEENPIFEGEDEETKAAEEKLRKEHLSANTFGNVKYTEKEVDEEIAKEKEKKQREKAEAKAMQKMLLNKEKRNDYEKDDSDRDPLASSSDSDSDEDEDIKEEDKDQTSAPGAADALKAKETNTSAPSSTKGQNTPTGRDEKRPLKMNGLKRPGSPNLSDASGTESARKKLKKAPLDNLKNNNSSGRSSADEGRSRQTSLAPRTTLPGGQKPLRKVSALNPGSGSDSEATDSGTKAQRIMLRMGGGSRNGSPTGSRAGSPAATPNGNISPAAGIAAPLPAALPSEKEILAEIPPEGLSLGELSRRFRSRIPRDKIGQFSNIVKRITSFDSNTKLVKRK